MLALGLEESNMKNSEFADISLKEENAEQIKGWTLFGEGKASLKDSKFEEAVEKFSEALEHL